jgi:hypothetical protein
MLATIPGCTFYFFKSTNLIRKRHPRYQLLTAVDHCGSRGTELSWLAATVIVCRAFMSELILILQALCVYVRPVRLNHPTPPTHPPTVSRKASVSVKYVLYCAQLFIILHFHCAVSACLSSSCVAEGFRGETNCNPSSAHTSSHRETSM